MSRINVPARDVAHLKKGIGTGHAVIAHDFDASKLIAYAAFVPTLRGFPTVCRAVDMLECPLHPIR